MNNYDFRNNKEQMNLVIPAKSKVAAENKARKVLHIKSLAKHGWKLNGAWDEEGEEIQTGIRRTRKNIP